MTNTNSMGTLVFLKRHVDERGHLMEILRCDSNEFKEMGQFGQVYMNLTRADVIKGFHKHKKQYDYVTIMKGIVKVILANEDFSSIKEYILSDEEPVAL